MASIIIIIISLIYAFVAYDQVGVKKLNETNAMVEGLKGDLTKLEPILEQASKDAEKLLKQVEIDKADAAKVKEKVSERPSDRATKRSIFIYFFNEIIK